MSEFFEHASTALLNELTTSAARSMVLAAVASAAIVLLRTKNTSLRLLIWTAVVYASLALPLLAWLVPAVGVHVPEFFSYRATALATGSHVTFPVTSASRTAANGTEIEVQQSASPALPAHSSPSTARQMKPATGMSRWSAPAIDGKVIASGIYLVIALFFVLRFAMGLRWSRKLARKSQAIRIGSKTRQLLSLQAYGFSMGRSDWISVPITVGVLRPLILLPPDWEQWDDAKLQAVLAHEQSHVLRRDPLTQSISLLYRAIFWFNPLSWWMHRHLVTLAELASDEAALSRGADRKQYARTLLGFFETLQSSPSRIRWHAVSMARSGQAKQRVERILEWKGTVAMNLKRSLAVTIIVLAIPVVMLVAAVRPVKHVSGQEVPVLYQSAPPAPTVTPAVRVAGVPPVPAIAPSGPATAVAPMAPSAPGMAAAVVAPAAPSHFGQHQSFGGGSFYSYGFDDDERFVITSGKSDSYTMSGSTQDIHHVEKLKKQIPGEFIWFQRDEQSYIIRDQATVDWARQLFKAQEELGKQQEELGKQQEALGKQQEELGKKMEEVRIDVPDMTAELDRLKAKLQKLGPTATMEQIGDLQSEIGELQSKIGELQGHAGDEQGKLGKLQGELGEKQGKLGEEQGKLGEKQAELGKRAAKQMKQLLDESIKNGAAKPEQDMVKGSGSL